MPVTSTHTASEPLRAPGAFSALQTEARAALEQRLAAAEIHGLKIFPGISDTCLRLDGWLPSSRLTTLGEVKSAVVKEFESRGLTVVYLLESDCGGWAQIAAC